MKLEICKKLLHSHAYHQSYCYQTEVDYFPLIIPLIQQFAEDYIQRCVIKTFTVFGRLSRTLGFHHMRT